MKVGDYDVHKQCLDKFLVDYKDITENLKSQEQSDFESLILGCKHYGSSIMTEDLTKDDENTSIKTKDYSLKMAERTTPPRKTFPFANVQH